MGLACITQAHEIVPVSQSCQTRWFHKMLCTYLYMLQALLSQEFFCSSSWPPQVFLKLSDPFSRRGKNLSYLCLKRSTHVCVFERIFARHMHAWLWSHKLSHGYPEHGTESAVRMNIRRSEQILCGRHITIRIHTLIEGSAELGVTYVEYMHICTHTQSPSFLICSHLHIWTEI